MRRLKERMSDGSVISTSRPVGAWYSALTPRHVRVLWGSFLGWMFDGYEQYAIVIALPAALRSLLPPSQLHRSSLYFGLTLCFTLLGWGFGGLAGGVLADYVGRKRMMMWSVLVYALFSGFSALSVNFAMLAVFRFITGLAIGSEWSTGVTLIAETWPNEARAKGCGFLQSAIGAGMLTAVAIWYGLAHFNSASNQNWRILFLIGALPAFIVLYLRRGLEESELWITAVRERHWRAIEGPGSQVSADERRPFTLSAIWSGKESRRRLVLTSICSLVTVIGWWAVSTLLPQFTNQLAKAQNAGDAWGNRAAMLYLTGAIVAYCVSGFLIDRIGRRRYLAFAYVGALVMTPLTYLWSGSLHLFMFVVLVNGFFTQGCCYAWMAIYVGELFSSTVRATACSFVFNCPRFVAALFPVGAGIMIESFGGASHTAVILGSVYAVGILVPWFLPETIGEPLPL
jgi:MFS family permease